MFVCINGNFVPASEAKVSVFDHGFLYGDGVYDTTRTYHGKVWKPFEHVSRLKQSASLISLPYAWSNEELADWMQLLVEKNGFDGNPDEGRVRIMVTRGINHFQFLSVKEPVCVVIAEELKPEPNEIYENGVHVATFSVERLLPGAKTISLLPLVLGRLHGERSGVYETLFLNRHGFVTEGSITNVFIVKRSFLRTPEENVLPGLAREVVLSFAVEIAGIERGPISLNDLYQADECFLTNSLREVVPVVSVDGRIVGDGKVGEITKLIMQRYQKLVRE